MGCRISCRISLLRLTRRLKSQHFSESSPEVCVAKGIEDRIECGIDVAEPQGDFEKCVTHAVWAHGHYHENDEIRQPTDDESAHDDAQLTCSFSLLVRNESRGIELGSNTAVASSHADYNRRRATRFARTSVSTAIGVSSSRRLITAEWWLLLAIANVFHIDTDIDVMS